MQTHRATGTSLFNVILPRERPSATTFDGQTVPVKDTQRDVTTRYILHGLQKWIELLKGAVTCRLSTTQRQYKRDFDNNVRQQPTFKIGYYMFVDRPQLAAIASDTAVEMESRRYNKLLLPRVWIVLSTKQPTAYINNHKRWYTEYCFYRAILRFPPYLNRGRQSNETMYTTLQQNENQQRRNAVKDTKRGTESDTTVPQEVRDRLHNVSCEHSQWRRCVVR